MSQAVTQTLKNILTFNVHSWLEEDQLNKLEQLADFIAEKAIDVIALQEVNQLMDSPSVTLDDYYIPSKEQQVPIKEDNFALLLVQTLNKRGHNYYWSWSENHIGYDRYDEGLAILAKQPFTAESHLVSPFSDYTNYQTRRLLKATFDDSLDVVCVHYSWWHTDQQQGFQYEWKQTLRWLESHSKSLIIAGDFNAPAGLESHQLLIQNPLSLKDSYDTSEERLGEATAPPVLDGWRERKLPKIMRIDYIWHSACLTPCLHQVVFDGMTMNQLSDHYGIYCEFD
ncbi:endonuclease/exonuclease/phosphatase family protein [Dolosicoccus paucivorans]|uniref:endonuclease/exonuclease/phosphatase family protein n=1 Tax=Dolosicoccus paucivorans TaxID=84521 RepID=UPI0008843089|nr:maltose 6'-phosphate phosphatase [Dolosicoccus paucivorans]